MSGVQLMSAVALIKATLKPTETVLKNRFVETFVAAMSMCAFENI